MVAAWLRNAAGRRPGALAPLCLGMMLAAAAAACQPAPAVEPMVRSAPRHPIQPPVPSIAPGPAPVAADRADTGRVTPGPNSRISPTPDMAPRVLPSDRPAVPSTQRDIDELRRDLQQQRRREPEQPGPPAGTIDRRPGTIRTTPGTVEVPR